MRKKRFIAAALLVYLTVVFAGCAANKKVFGDPNSSSKTGVGAKVTPAGTFPIVNEKQTLHVFCAQDTPVENYDTNDFTIWYENKTNIHVEWETVQGAYMGEKLQIKLAAGDLADIYMNSGLSESQIIMYASQGAFVPIGSLIDQYAPNVKKMFDKVPEAKAISVCPDGNIYGTPRVNESINEGFPKKMWIYKPWLDKLGLSMPTTVDEFYQVLKAFKTQDPNGNGRADEVPLAGAYGAKYANNEINGFLMMPFIYYDRGTNIYLDSGKVIFSADKPEYREGLQYLKKLFSEGLIAPDSFVQDRAALQALVENGQENRLGCVPAFYWGHFAIENGPSGRDKEFVAVPPLKGPTGLRQAYYRGSQIFANRIVISKVCKIPEAAMRWADWFYDNENMLAEGFSATIGKEGVGWKRAEEGGAGIDGRPAKYQLLIAPGAKQNNHWNQTVGTYEDQNYIFSAAAGTSSSRKEVFGTSESQEKYLPYASNKIVPRLYFTEAQTGRLGDIKKNIENTVESYMIKFVTGTLDLDKDWDAYLKGLKNIKADEYVKVSQEAYDIYVKNLKK